MSSASETGNLTMLITNTTAVSTTANATVTAMPAASSTVSFTSTMRAIVATVTTAGVPVSVRPDHSAVIVRDEWLWIYIGVCCVLGIVLNVIVVWSLMRTKCNGNNRAQKYTG